MRHLTILPAITSGNQTSRSLERHLNELKRIPLLTAEKELHLTQRIRSGDQQALEQLVCANLRFVVSIAKQYQHNGLPLLDLINEGNIGLILAADRFDGTKGFKFISYAVCWIRNLILEAIRDQTPKDLLRQMICDADLYHLTLWEYPFLQQQLKEGRSRIFDEHYSDRSWQQQNLSFLENHHYFTLYGESVLQRRKAFNRERCRQLIT